MNKVVLMGNLGADAEATEFSGRWKISFRIATTETWTDRSGEKQELTEWHRCAVWKPTGGLAKFLRKGTKVLVEGRIRTREYEKEGQKHYATDIDVRDLEFADGKRGEDVAGGRPEPIVEAPVPAPATTAARMHPGPAKARTKASSAQRSLADDSDEIPF